MSLNEISFSKIGLDLLLPRFLFLFCTCIHPSANIHGHTVLSLPTAPNIDQHKYKHAHIQLEDPSPMPSMKPKPKMKIIIVGAGFGGIGMAVALKNIGINDFMILEKGPDVGGVWRDNTYPGCACDVPSHLYSFSFAPYNSRKTQYPPQRDILRYLQTVTTDWALLSHLQLNAEVTALTFRDDENMWDVMTISGTKFRAEVIIFAVGQLHLPNFPDITGLDEFPGPVMHPARWDQAIDLHDKNIAIIGTGSSAAQMLPTLASISCSVTIYQRTPHWVLPKPNQNFSTIGRLMLRLPGSHKLYRSCLYYGADILISPIARSKVLRGLAEWVAKRNLRQHIQDVELRKKLMPLYPIGSKRIVIDSHFYPALNCENVKLIAEPIERITESKIETRSGTFTSADIIVCATGFKASEFLIPITIQGRNGRSLHEDWKDGASAFMGLAVHGYPNAFMIAGPNTFNQAGSNPMMKEHQIAYILKCLRWKWRTDAETIEVSSEATARYQIWLDESMSRTVWPTSVDSWYKHKSGKITNPWPASARTFERMLQDDPQHSFILKTA